AALQPDKHDWTRDACEDLARLGYVVMLVYDGRPLGTPDGAAESDSTARNPALTWQATTHADLQAVALLRDRREADPERVAVLGLQTTARRAWWAAALEEHLAAVVSLGTPETSRLEDRVLTCLIAPRPHRLAL